MKFEKHSQECSTIELFDNRVAKKWLNTKQAAEFLAVTPNALRIMVCRKQIRASKLRGRLRFQISDCELLLLQKED